MLEVKDWELNHDSQIPGHYTPQYLDEGIGSSTYLNVNMDLVSRNISTLASATGNNNQRKLCRESSGKLHEVFESGGEIYYNNSTNDGMTWQTNVRLSSGAGGSTNTCVTLSGSNLISTWQHANGSNFDIQISRSTNGGGTWSGPSTVLTVACSSPGPIPSVSLYNSSAIVVYRTSSGTMNAKKSTNAGSSWTNISAVPGSTSNCNNPSTMIYNTPWLVAQANLAYASDLPTGSPRIYYVYYDFDVSNWGGSTDITSVVPSQYTAHGNPCLAVAPLNQGNWNVHVVWDATPAPPPPNQKVVIHRKLGFRSPGSVYYVLAGYGENKPSMASVQDDRLWMVSASNNVSYLMKRSFTGSAWLTPSWMAPGAFNPQVSVQRGASSIPAKYLYTTGSASRYQITVASEQLSKFGSPNVYSRELNIIDSTTGSSATLELGKPSIILSDGTEIPIEFNWDLSDTTEFDLPTLLLAGSTNSFSLPPKATKIVVPMTASSNDPTAMFASKEGSVGLSITDSKSSVITATSISSSTLQSSRLEPMNVEIPVTSLMKEMDGLKITPSFGGLRNDKKFIYSLGHVYRASSDIAVAKESSVKNQKMLPENFSLDGYPNPFNPSTTIRFSLIQDGRVQLRIYDMLGREVEKLFDRNLPRGMHDVVWNASGLSSGVYFARILVTDELGKSVYSASEKLVLTK
jgi:hypothetical protein